MLPTFLQNLVLQEAVETLARINEKLKEQNSIEHFAKNSNFEFQSIKFLHFSAKRCKSVGKMNHQKK